MAYSAQELRALKEKTLRKVHLEKRLDELDIQRADIEDKVFCFSVSKEREQKEADRLEGRSLAALFYTVIGKKEEKLEKEQREAKEAAVRYDAAARELAAVNDDIERFEAELRSLKDCENNYAKAMEAASAEIKASGKPEAEEIVRLEQENAVLLSRLKELDEALAAGDAAYKTVRKVLEKLTKAEDWGTWDIMGGGMLADLAKHEVLDEAQELVETMQVDLRRFKTELSDVELDCNISVNIDGFTRFADFFFDGLFADLASLKKIEKSKEQVQKIKSSLETTLNSVIRKQESVDSELAKLREKLDGIIISAS